LEVGIGGEKKKRKHSMRVGTGDRRKRKTMGEHQKKKGFAVVPKKYAIKRRAMCGCGLHSAKGNY